jgi:hypothetical protein
MDIKNMNLRILRIEMILKDIWGTDCFLWITLPIYIIIGW